MAHHSLDLTITVNWQDETAQAAWSSPAIAGYGRDSSGYSVCRVTDPEDGEYGRFCLSHSEEGDPIYHDTFEAAVRQMLAFAHDDTIETWDNDNEIAELGVDA